MYRNRYYRQSRPTPRNIQVKYAGQCACCGAQITVGAIATYYPIGTIAGVHVAKIAHVGGLDGTSQVCFNNLKARADNSLNAYAGDGLDQRYEDDCKDRCGL